MRNRTPLLLATAALGAIATTTLAQDCGWSPLSTGIQTRVHGLGVHNGELYIAGAISTAGGMSANNVVRWDGQEFHNVGSANDQTTTFQTFQNDLFMGGRFDQASGNPANALARWDGQEWQGVTNFDYRFVFSCCTVNTMTVYDGELYIGGTFDEVDGVLATFIAKWDGQTWAGLGPTFESGSRDHRGVTGIVHDMVVHDEGRGQGPVLFVAGGFTQAGGQPIRGIARWNGQEWSDVGGSVTQTTGQYTPQALAVFDGDLYAAGRFNSIGNVGANRIARWDGELWWDVAGGIFGSFTYYGDSLAVFDDGTGEALYVGGTFDGAGAVNSSSIVRWDGQMWSAVGDGVNGLVRALQVWNGGLFAGGSFSEAGGEPADRIARWSCEQECYANCDGSTSEPILTVNDFTCFINEFAQAQTLSTAQQIEHYANCDGSTTEPVLTVNDFTCFINEFAQGCP